MFMFQNTHTRDVKSNISRNIDEDDNINEIGGNKIFDRHTLCDYSEHFSQGSSSLQLQSTVLAFRDNPFV